MYCRICASYHVEVDVIAFQRLFLPHGLVPERVAELSFASLRSLRLKETALSARLSRIPTTRRRPSCGTAVQMSCHPFQVDEVFRFIVEQLVALDSRSALSLALCCKSLKDLSLSALWERQKRLSTLIKVLPPDAWAYQETDSPVGELVGYPRSTGYFSLDAQFPVL